MSEPRRPKPIISLLQPVYPIAESISYPLFRIFLGGFMLLHAYESGKLTGATTIGKFAAGLAHRGLEPSAPLAYLVFCTETGGAVLMILGLCTRLAAGAFLIELLVIAIVVYWPKAFFFNKAGAEFPFFWALMSFVALLRGGGPYSLDRLIGYEL